MRLQPDDLLSYCRCMDGKTNKKYKLNAEKDKFGYWELKLINNESGEGENLAGGLTLREAHEFVRAFYRGLEYSKILNFNN